jgi:hypothetical protein
VKLNKKLFKIFLFLFSLFLFMGAFLFSDLYLGKLRAQEPTFSFYPDGGTVKNKEQGFVVDILIDTAGEEIVSAKFTVLFDPEVLQLKKAERNNTLFSDFPDDESSIDNRNGVVMLSGFTQSGTSSLYVTGDKADVLARLTFEVLQEGEVTLDWEYGGEDAVFDTAIYKDGSPPQNILLTKPNAATFTIGDVITDPSAPATGISVDKYILVTGIVLTLFGAFMVFTRPGGFRRKAGTVVIYDE